MIAGSCLFQHVACRRIRVGNFVPRAVTGILKDHRASNCAWLDEVEADRRVKSGRFGRIER